MDDIIFNLSRPQKSAPLCFAQLSRAMVGLRHSSSLIHRERLTREKSESSAMRTSKQEKEHDHPMKIRSPKSQS